jgi:hypothetical protein
MHLKNGRSVGNGAYTREGTTSRVIVASRLKVSLLLAAPIPEIMDSPLTHAYRTEEVEVITPRRTVA